MKGRDVEVALKAADIHPRLRNVLVEMCEEHMVMQQAIVSMAQQVDRMTDILGQIVQGTDAMQADFAKKINRTFDKEHEGVSIESVPVD